MDTSDPISKAGKSRHLRKSHRPISHLSPAIKVLERLILPELVADLPLSKTHHGFHKNRSITSTRLPLTHKVIEGFNRETPPSRTVDMTIDFSKAFDTCNHTNLLTAISNSSLSRNTIRWLSTYLRARFACCRYNRVNAVCHAVRVGVQTSILPTVYR